MYVCSSTGKAGQLRMSYVYVYVYIQYVMGMFVCLIALYLTFPLASSRGIWGVGGLGRSRM